MACESVLHLPPVTKSITKHLRWSANGVPSGTSNGVEGRGVASGAPFDPALPPVSWDVSCRSVLRGDQTAIDNLDQELHHPTVKIINSVPPQHQEEMLDEIQRSWDLSQTEQE